MKTTIFFLMIIFSFSALAICNREAQFIGTVKNVKQYSDQSGSIEYSSYQIKLGNNGQYWFQTNPLCAMWEDEVESAIIFKAGASTKKNGDKVSGVLVFDELTKTYRLE